MLKYLLAYYLSVSNLNPRDINIDNMKVSSIEDKVNDNLDFSWDSAEIYDLNSWSSIWESNAEKELPVASLTKLMTALIIIENHKLNEVVKVSRNAVYTDWWKVYLLPNEKFSVWDMLKGLLIKSWNDAAVALAEFHSWSVESFVKEMNMRAKDLRLIHTHFNNPTWMDATNHYSTAKDLALLTSKVLEYDYLRKVVWTKLWTMISKDWRKIDLPTTNKLLWWIVKWVKTWTTEKAWECLITLVELKNKRFLFVLLGSGDRFDTTEKLVDFIITKL